MSSQRAYRRLDTNFLANVRLRAETDTTVLMRKRVTNLSLGGVFIETAVPLSLDTLVEFDFQIKPNSDPIHIVGVVRWSDPNGKVPGMGVEFLEVSTKSKEVIQDYVDTRIAEDGIAVLTQSPLHRSLLKLYYRKIGESFPLELLANFLGCGVYDLKNTLEDFTNEDIARFEEGTVKFMDASDVKTAEKIEKWIESDASHKDG